jgi:iron complex transport system substrate-binding protein
MKLSPLILLLLILIGCRQQPTPSVRANDYQRIVALAPSLSETVFALGLGDRVVGVTAFADYPSAVTNLPKVGGYSEINIEAVYTLKPDLVLALNQQGETIERLQSLGIPTAAFNNTSLNDIKHMIKGVGELLNRPDAASQYLDNIEASLAAIIDQTGDLPSRRILVSVGRNMGTGSISEVYVAGRKTIYGEIIEQLGAENVYQGDAPYVALSREAILRLNPDVILDLIPNLDQMHAYSRSDALKQWQVFETINAVTQNQVIICAANYICIPGPRVGLMIRDLAHSIYPEISNQR